MNAYPNPFSAALTITYEVVIDNKRPITISIYDAAGRRVKTFEESTTAQSHQIVWTGVDDFGRELPGGIYFIKFDGAEQSLIKKAILLR
jgi:flagellar hook assembly protein FlgD